MNDTGTVRRVQRVGHLGAQVEDVVHGQRPARDAGLERLALEQFHDHELLPVVLTDVVQRADVGMAEGRDDARFAQEAIHRLRIAAGLDGQQLDGDVATETGVLGLIHHAHTAAAQLRDDAVVGNGAADQ